MAKLDFDLDEFKISVRNPDRLLVMIADEDSMDQISLTYTQLKAITNRVETEFPEQAKEEAT